MAAYPGLTRAQHEAVYDAVVRALRPVEPELFESDRGNYPGGLIDLDAHIDALVAIVRRTTADRIEPYLAQILDEICGTCAYEYPSGFCALRHRGLCVLYARAEIIARAVADALVQLHDADYYRARQPPPSSGSRD